MIRHRIRKLFKDFYVQYIIKNCRKCNKPIIPKEGYWHWDNKPHLKGGYYHTECGMINNKSTQKGDLPF